MPENQPQPTVNRYTSDVKATPSPAPSPSAVPSPKVDPTAPAPTQPSTPSTSAQPAVAKPTAPVSPAKPATPAPAKSAPPSSPIAKRGAILGCLGAFGSLMLILLILSFVFLAQSDSTTTNPIAKLLGLNQAVFINDLITFVHIIFILISLVAFVFTMVGLFRASMAKKEDKDIRRAGLKSAFISGTVLFIVLIVWGFTFVYLNGKQIRVSGAILDPIVTTPPNNLGLITGQTAPVDIQFDASNVPFDKKNYQIVSHDWDFGDGTTATGQKAQHTFKTKGTFDVKLKLSLKNKKTGEISGTAEHHITVSIESTALSAIIKADPETGEVPLDVKLDAGDSADPDGTIKTYGWDLNGDGKYDDGTDPQIEHTFDKIGKYKISLQIVSSTGKHAETDKEIVVTEQSNPAAIITVADEPQSFSIGQNYVFQGENSTSPNGKITKYEWSFSDSSKGETTKTISHSFKLPGSYQVTLKVTDEKDKTNEAKKEIKVESAKGTPKAKINTDPALAKDITVLTGKAPFTVVFDAKDSTDSDNNINDYKWDFDGDGKFDSYGNIASHTYTAEGSYNVQLAVEDNDKNVGTSSLVVKVESTGVIAAVTSDKVDGNVPLIVNFDGSGSSYSKGKISSYKWDFGDGTPAKVGAATISHKYTAVGTYSAKVTVTASDGKVATQSLNITIREIPLTACFTSVFEKGQAPLEDSFDPGCSTGAISNYFWDFGDGSTSTNFKPTHTFQKAGTYKVSLEVSDSQNTVNKSEATIVVSEP